MSNVPSQIGNYTLERQIGRGASSEVWLARHLHLPERPVAIKVLMSQDRDSIARFTREAKIAARLQHANIVQLYDYGTYPPFHCSIFQYVEGGSLSEFIDRHGKVELTHALGIFRDIAGALDYAHSLGLVHRDVSPGNILIAQSDGRALLTDFGIARELNTSLTTMSAIMGTPGFWSPEHLQSATAVTRLSDLFSLGVVLYMMISGKMPWDESPHPGQPIFPPPHPLRERGVEHLPAAVDRVLQTMLAPDPAKRYPTARAALDDLERIFARHHRITEIMHGKGEQHEAGESDEGWEHRLQTNGVGFDEVEHALGPDCLRAPLVDAHERAADLSQPATVADLLNGWSDEHWLRRPLLGRLAVVHETTSYNLYFYQLQILFERRTAPETVEEPDTDHTTFELEPELDRWQVPLPAPEGFGDAASGSAPIPGSARVASCGECKGRGKITCPECGGTRRVKVMRAVEPVPPGGTTNERLGVKAGGSRVAATQPQPSEEAVVVPCPRCGGHGGLRCGHCAGTGRLLQQQIFRWKRWSWQNDSRDALENERHETILAHCERHEIYRERATNAICPEWKLVPAFATMIERAMSDAPDDARVVLSEAVVSFVPVTEIVFDLDERDRKDPKVLRLHTLPVYGFERLIPNDWTFFNWDRALLVFGGGFLFFLALVVILVSFVR